MTGRSGFQKHLNPSDPFIWKAFMQQDFKDELMLNLVKSFLNVKF
jgi:hypothetical protein